MTLIDRAYFTAVEQCGENNGPVHLDLSLCDDPSPVSNVLVKCAEGGARFSVSGVDLVINDAQAWRFSLRF